LKGRRGEEKGEPVRGEKEDRRRASSLYCSMVKGKMPFRAFWHPAENKSLKGGLQ
jgi:hypothetical protein